MSRENLTIGFPLRSCTLAGGSWLTARPLTKALNFRELNDPARSTDATTDSTQFVATLTEGSRPVGCVALADHNLSLDALVRVRLLDSEDAEIEDSGWVEAWPEVYGAFSLDWGDPAFMSLRPNANELAQEIATFVHLFDTSRICAKVEVQIDDTDNPDGYVDIGFFAAANATELTINLAYGAREGFEQRSYRQVSQGGNRYVERRNKPRVLEGDVVMETGMRRSLIDRMQRECDLDKPFVVIQEPSADLFRPLTQWLAYWSELTPGERAYYGLDRQVIKFEQVL